MKIRGQILWNVTPICETSQISCLMGRRPVKDGRRSLYVNTHRSETSGIADTAVRQQCCYNRGWMKNGGLLLWNAVAICEMTKTSWQLGRHFTNGDLENHSKARSYHVVQWLEIIRLLRNISRGSTNLVRKCCLEDSSDMHGSRKKNLEG